MLVNGKRALAHTEKIEWIKPIEGADNIELVGILGWTCIAKIGEFKKGDVCVYIEIDSKVPEKEWSEFLRPKHFKVKTMKLGKFKVISQGLALPLSAFDVEIPAKVGIDVTDLLGITYSVAEDNIRKAPEVDKYQRMARRMGKKFSKNPYKWLMKRSWGKVLLFSIYGKAGDKSYKFPTKFEYIHKTDQERVENIPQILESTDKFIRTQKCDGSSATYILERKKNKNKFEFYVCSRKNFYPDTMNNNPYWEMAKKYRIQEKLEDILNHHPEWEYICWQGEICGPKIQKNPHHLEENHLFLFHMITSDKGMWDIRDAKYMWDNYTMESVPIEKELVTLENNMEDFKLTADGYYDPIVCMGHFKCPREGFVYYKADDPNFSFKNVSRKYLLKH